ncbi:MAG: VWA domain-containing protein [Limnospira sp. PMC 1291.21]|nr:MULTISPECIES: VWA domain-containing protein [Limnospira]MDT9176069.1 VWA domain-containing protein [Limnospira sp. PMC 1238.20]MDT9266127.1 VWA domain-containing protein [Limnospira sp. PMC 1223.20]MDT9298672.1 VWA domain-containing protein [Limnospira sp. PMC 1281.21]MDT9206766.1 VWA domain-containing protein [Limnospira sp. PMC 1252.20]MDT9211871.1 VWA domain-containing protein [Limnospira sp. PMC 1256.20]
MYFIIAFSIRWLSGSAIALMIASPVFGKTAEIVGRPRINNDNVTLRLQVRDGRGRPVMQLQESDFQVITDDEPVGIKSWQSPQESTPPPAWIVVLVDLSGSMNELDTSGKRRIDGALDATRRFLEQMSDRGGDTKVAIVPFGEGGRNCPGFEVTQRGIDSRFFPANDIKQTNFLDYLAAQTLCAATDIYSPLSEAIRVLGNRQDPRFYVPEDSGRPEPRLSVILLSDGFHNQPNEQQDFDNLITLLERNNNIIVHTLGYGLTPQQVGQKYNLGRAATRADADKNPQVAREFVDKERLQTIAETTGGIAEFSGNANDIARNLQLFLDSLLGEYEIVFQQPNAERGTQHEVLVQVTVNNQQIKTQPKTYTMMVFGRSLPQKTRLIMTGILLLVLILGGVIPFLSWSNYMKREAEHDF